MNPVTPPRGMRVLTGTDARRYTDLLNRLRSFAQEAGLSEIVLPAVWSSEPFVARAGDQILEQMYTFKDRSDRSLCLIPEATAIVSGLYAESRQTEALFYITRCYRYERPQAGRYREFTQFGVEIINPDADAKDVLLELSQKLMDVCEVADYVLDTSVRRGLAYYVEDGFEISIPTLGAQKQVLGGGRYSNGIGFAVGVERLLLAAKEA